MLVIIHDTVAGIVQGWTTFGSREHVSSVYTVGVDDKNTRQVNNGGIICACWVFINVGTLGKKERMGN